MTVLPAFEQAGQSFCVPSMALILLVQVSHGYLPPSVADNKLFNPLNVRV